MTLLFLLTLPAAAAAPSESMSPSMSSNDDALTITTVQDSNGEVLELTPSEPSAEINYQLPSEAKQGPEQWYVVRLHVRIEADSQARSESIVSASTNDHACAQLNLKSGGGELSNSGYGLVDGRQDDRSRADSLELWFANYLQLGGVRGGENILTLMMETFEGPPPRSVTILNDSRIERTTLNPYEVELAGPDAPVIVSRGDTARLPYRLARKGTRADASATVRVDTAGSPIEVLGEPTRSFNNIGDGRQGDFEIRPSKPGTYNLMLVAKTGYNTPAYPVQIIVPPDSERYLAVAVPALGVTLVIGAVAIVAYPRLRRRRT